MSQLNDSTENKKCEKYPPVSVRCVNNTTGGSNKDKGKISFTKAKRNTAKRRKRRNRSSTTKVSYKNATGEKYIKNLSNEKRTESQIKLISRGLKFIPTNTPNKNKIRMQLLRDALPLWDMVLRFSTLVGEFASLFWFFGFSLGAIFPSRLLVGFGHPYSAAKI